MKKRFGKKIHPDAFLVKQLQDLKNYQLKMAARAEKYAKLASIKLERCYLCEDNKFSNFVTIYDFNYIQCQKCTHIMLSKRLGKEDLLLFYKKDSQYASTYTDKDLISYRLKSIAKPKVDFVMSSTGRQKLGLWLDIGCAIGDVVKAVEDYPGWRAIGLDINKTSVKLGKEIFNVDLRVMQFNEFIFKNKKDRFDIISAFGYLILTTDPLEELKLIRENLKDGGYLVIGESNGDSVTTILQKSYPELTLRHFLPPAVINVFTPKSLLKVLDKLQFKPVALWNFGLDFAEWLRYSSILDNRFKDSPIYNFLLDNYNEFQKVIDKKMMGDYMIVIAQKQ